MTNDERVFYLLVIGFLSFMSLSRVYLVYENIQIKAENKLTNVRLKAHATGLKVLFKAIKK